MSYLITEERPTEVTLVAAPAQVLFTFDFVIFDVGDLGVLVDGATAPAYDVAGVGDENGGSVTFEEAMVGGEEVILHRIVPIQRTVNLPSVGPYSTDQIDREFDRHTAIMQQLKTAAGRALSVGLGDTIGALPFDREGLFLSFDAERNPIMVSGTGNDPDFRFDLAGDDGGTFMGLMGSFNGEVRTTPAKVYEDAPLTFERFGGGPGESDVANSTAAAFITEALGGTGGRGRVILNGRYLLAEPWLLPMDCYHIEIEGQTRYRSELRVTADNVPVIEVPEGAICHSLALRRLELAGTGWEEGTARTQHGFFMPDILDAGNQDAFGLVFEDVGGRDLSGNVLRIGARGFTVQLIRVHGDDIGSDMIYGGNNTWKASGCYGHRLRKRAGEPSTGAVFRFLAGQISLNACNGLDSGDLWLDMGSAQDDGDDENIFAYATITACNLEAFAGTALRNRNGSFHIFSSTFISKAGSVSKAILSRNGGAGIGGILDNPGCFILGGTLLGTPATWAEGFPVHTVSNRAPFSEVLGGVDDASPVFEWWVADDEVIGFMPKTTLAHAGNYDWHRVLSHLRVTHKLSCLNVAGNALSFGNHVDDAAAAIGGVAVGEFYRSGSAVKVRES